MILDEKIACKEIKFTGKDIKGYSKLFWILSNEYRLRILLKLYLEEKGVCVKNLVEYLEAKQSNISGNHIKSLADCNIIYPEKIGKYNFYHLNKNSPLRKLKKIFECIFYES